MRKEKNPEKNIFHNLLLFTIAITILFLFLATWTGIKINDNLSCSTDRIYEGENTGLTNSQFVLNDSSTAVLQEFSFSKTYLDYKFCFDVNTSTNNIISIVNQKNEGLGKVYVSNITTYYCSYLEKDYIQNVMQIGIRCETCDTNEVTILQEILGDDIYQTKTDFSNTVQIYSSNPLSYRIFAYDNCKTILKYITGWYLVVLTLVVFLTMIIFGYSKFKEFLFDVGGDIK